jgi:hypothetical protein
MKPFAINPLLRKFDDPAEAEEHNRQCAANAALLCESRDDVCDLAVELAGHLSTHQYSQFEQMLWDAWMDLNVNRICAEVAQNVRNANGEL